MYKYTKSYVIIVDTREENKQVYIRSQLKSAKLFCIIVGIFASVSLYLAVSKDFPGVFDEAYHFALIDFYSGKLSPFIASQPYELSIVGDATRMSSYLSHYLLGFFQWIVKFFIHDTFTQVVLLRIVNVTIVISALVLFRIFLVRLTKSRLVADVSIALYCLIPVTTQLASTINYDNWILLCVALSILLAQKIFEDISSSHTVPLDKLVIFISVLGFSSLIKFTFLPIAVTLAFGVFTAILTALLFRDKTRAKFIRFSHRQMLLPLCLLLVASGLMMERYGYNLLKYNSFQPDCSVVQSTELCMNYGPWARNYGLALSAQQEEFDVRSLQGYFVNLWLPISTQGLSYFGANDTMTSLSRIVHSVVSVVVGILSLGMGTYLLKARKHTMQVAIYAASFVYILVLLVYNYTEYTQLHQPIAIQGRYLLPLMIPLGAMGVMGISTYYRLLVRSLMVSRKIWTRVDDLTYREACSFSKRLWSTE